MKTFSKLLLVIQMLFLLLINPGISQSTKNLNPEEVVEKIEKVYLGKIAKLKRKIKAHFATRMYRVTGDSTYVKHITPYARYLVKKIKTHNANWDENGYKEKMAINTLATWPNTEKNRRRIYILSKQLD